MLILGADPEVFVGDSSGVRSIIGKIGGTKSHPRPLPIGDGFAIQEDNVALEFNIPPSNTRELFVDNISRATQFIETALQDSYGLHFVKESAVSFPEDELNCPEAFVFGCDPDFNAWTGDVNPKPRADDYKLRSCGGHVHLDYRETKYAHLRLRDVIKSLDLHLAVPSVIMDSGILRKQLYGKAGAYRKKSYGGEYRVLSNYWIFDRRLSSWIYDATERAFEFVFNNGSFEEDGALIQSAINDNDHSKARFLIDKYSLGMA